MTVVYTTDFAVGSDTGLLSYTGGSVASTWSSVRNGSSLTIPAARDRVESTLSNDDATAFVSFTGVPTGDQKISGNFGVTTGYDAGYPAVRCSAGNHYQLNRADASTWELYRQDGAGTYTLINSWSVSTTNNTTQALSLKAEGAGATVTITPTIAGSDRTPYGDTAANRKTSGNPGVGIYHFSAADTRWVDDIEVDDLSVGGGSTPKGPFGLALNGPFGRVFG